MTKTSKQGRNEIRLNAPETGEFERRGEFYSEVLEAAAVMISANWYRQVVQVIGVTEYGPTNLYRFGYDGAGE